jgi:hypothetical protein
MIGERLASSIDTFSAIDGSGIAKWLSTGLRGNDIPCCWIRWGDLSNLPRSLVGDVLALAAKDSSAQLGVISAAEGVGREI